MASGAFEFMPDFVLLKILKYLDVCDLYSLSKVNSRFSRLSFDRVLVRDSCFEAGYALDDAAVRAYMASAGRHVRRLDFSHCHWLAASTIAAAVRMCAAHLVALHVVECRLRADALVTLLTAAAPPALADLSFSVATFVDLRREVFAPAAVPLAGLLRLSVFYTSREIALMSYVGEHATLLDLCPRLERFSVGAPGPALPELFRPLVASPSRRLRAFALTPHMHAGAQMLFYGLLAQLPHAELAWRCLLMPNVNVGEFAKRRELAACLRGAHRSLEQLDVSGSRVRLPHAAFAVADMPRLRFVGLARTAIDGHQVALIAAACRQLISVNLNGCGELFTAEKGKDARGVLALFKYCKQLRHLNIGDGHNHIVPPGGALVCEALDAIKGLHSLSLSTCMLYMSPPVGGAPTMGGASYAPSRPEKRTWTCPRTGATKRQCTEVGGRSEHPPGDGETASRSIGDDPCPLAASQSDDRPILSRLAEHNPDLRELEIIAAKFESAFHRNAFVKPMKQVFSPCAQTRLVTDSDLTPIGQFKCLHTLTLVGIPGLGWGSCLKVIAVGCGCLQRLSLAFLGNALCTTSLTRALASMTQLEDFRLEQPYLVLTASLFDGIACCQRLRRLCIIAKSSTFEPKHIEHLMERLTKLTVLQLFAGGTFVACKRLTTSLNHRYVKNRPALSITIYPLLSNGIAEVTTGIPSKHLDELTRFCSRVCAVPPNIFSDSNS